MCCSSQAVYRKPTCSCVPTPRCHGGHMLPLISGVQLLSTGKGMCAACRSRGSSTKLCAGLSIGFGDAHGDVA